MHRTRFLIAPVALAIFLFAIPALADMQLDPIVEKQTTDGNVHFNPFAGFYEFTYNHNSQFVIDAVGTETPITDWGRHHLRLSPSINWRDLYFNVEADLWSEEDFGNYEDFAPGMARFDRRDRNVDGSPEIVLRNAFIQWKSPIGLLKIGHMLSSYGDGALVNSGKKGNRFGEVEYGDTVERILFATTPFLPLSGKGSWGEYLTFLISGDLVYWDENADLLAGDMAYQVSAGVMYRHPEYSNGLIFSYRKQEDDDGDNLEVYAINLNGQNRFSFHVGGSVEGSAADEAGVAEEELTAESDPQAVETAAEGEAVSVPVEVSSGFEMALSFDYEFVTLLGSTTRLQQLGTPDGLDIKAFGAVGRLTYELVPIGLEIEFEMGYASGDNDPYDKDSTAFFFDPDFNVGMIFFEEMLPLISARAVEEMTDPERSNQVPKGLDLIPTKGRVTNTIYYLPQIRYTPPLGGTLAESLQLAFAAAILTTPTRFSHPYYTFENGGTPTNHLRARTESNYLGTEILTALRFRFEPLVEHLGLKVGLEYAHFLPGAALSYPDGSKIDAVWKIMTTCGVEWQ